LVSIFSFNVEKKPMSRRQRVLVVDDNAVNREIIEEILASDFQVLMAENGTEAVSMAQRHHPSVVLLDVMLPGADGYAICRRLRSMPGMADLRIIMVTAKAMPSERARGFDAGADAYVTKPFDDGDLVAAIRALLVRGNEGEVMRQRQFSEAC
jgi:CheY-like chemotaxis protein